MKICKIAMTKHVFEGGDFCRNKYPEGMGKDHNIILYMDEGLPEGTHDSCCISLVDDSFSFSSPDFEELTSQEAIDMVNAEADNIFGSETSDKKTAFIEKLTDAINEI